MLETLAFGIAAVFALLFTDLLVRRLVRGPAPRGPGPTILQAARTFGLFLLGGTLASTCRTGTDLGQDLLWMAVFGLSGLLAIELASALGQRALAGMHAAAHAGNLAAATAAGAHTIAIGILVANVFGGRSFGELGLAAASFAIGQLSLLLLVWLFRCLTAYDDRSEILDQNLAAALSHGGLSIALALLIGFATDGDYQGPLPALRSYGIALAEGLVVYPLRQLVVQCLILRARPSLFGGELDRAIGERRDVGAGALEALTYLAAALFVRSLA